MSLLNVYTFGPVSKQAPQQLVILLHGLGSNGKDLISLAPYYARVLPDAVFVSPDAPFPCDMAPFGHQWFSLQEWTPESILRGVQQAAPILESFITEQMKKYNVPPEKTALVGFSQGTMMSLYAGPRHPEKLAGVLGYSGALVWGDEIDGHDMHKIGVHLIHGDADPVVPVDAFHQAKRKLVRAGFIVTGGVTPGLMHNIDEAGIRDGAAFLLHIFS